MELAALDYRNIDPPAARVARVDFDHGYWWTDERGRLWLALEREQPWLAGPERLVWQFSIVLDGLPAGRARNYGLRAEALRGRLRMGPLESRWVSRFGIADVYVERGGRLRGSFRLEAGQYGRRLLGEWDKPRRYLILGTFTAVHDESRGGRIAAETEAYGWEHGRAASQPATRPVSRPGPRPVSQPGPRSASQPAR